MNRTTTRIALRLHRFEIAIAAGLTLLGVGLTLLVCSWLDATGFGGVCLDAMRNGLEMSAACGAASEAFYRLQSHPLHGLSQALTLAMPFLLAVIAGVGIVGREIERGTARLAWSLAPSRTVWLAGRVLPLLAMVAAVALAAGLVADRLLASDQPGMNPWASLLDFGNRGVALAARIVFTFACAVLIGALLGRALPALLVTVVVVFVGIAGGSGVHGRILASEAVPVAVSTYNAADLNFDSGFLAPDGRLISWEEMARIDGRAPDDPGEWTPSYPQAMRLVPGTRYPEIAAREVTVLLAGAAVSLALTFGVVRRARPG